MYYTDLHKKEYNKLLVLSFTLPLLQANDHVLSFWTGSLNYSDRWYKALYTIPK